MLYLYRKGKMIIDDDGSFALGENSEWHKNRLICYRYSVFFLQNIKK